MTHTGSHVERVQQRTHEGFLRHAHYRWLFVAAGVSALAISMYALAVIGAQVHGGPRPSGGTWLGYVLGTVSALLIVWLACLGVRKRAVTDGHYSLKAWVSAHVYLGLSLLVLATLHTGFQFGWNVHTLAYSLMILVIASGGLGVWAYSVLPRALSRNRGERTRKQMLDTLGSLDAQLQAAALPLDREIAGVVRLSVEETELGGGFWKRVIGSYGDCANARAIARLQPRLRAASGAEAEALAQIDGLLRAKAEALGVARRQMRIIALLEGWLFVHIPATFALLAALTAHILSVFLYW